MYDDNQWTDTMYNEYTNSIAQQLMNYYQYTNPKSVKIIPVVDKQDFIHQWNQLPAEMRVVVTNFHANPVGYEFDEVTIPVDTNLLMTEEEILKELDYKKVDLLINLGCNSNGYGEYEAVKIDIEEPEVPYAYAWHLKGVKEQFVSEGYVVMDSSYSYAALINVPEKILDPDSYLNGQDKNKDQNGNFSIISGCGNLRKDIKLYDDQTVGNGTLFTSLYYYSLENVLQQIESIN